MKKSLEDITMGILLEIITPENKQKQQDTLYLVGTLLLSHYRQNSDDDPKINPTNRSAVQGLAKDILSPMPKIGEYSHIDYLKRAHTIGDIKEYILNLYKNNNKDILDAIRISLDKFDNKDQETKQKQKRKQERIERQKTKEEEKEKALEAKIKQEQEQEAKRKKKEAWDFKQKKKENFNPLRYSPEEIYRFPKGRIKQK